MAQTATRRKIGRNNPRRNAGRKTTRVRARRNFGKLFSTKPRVNARKKVAVRKTRKAPRIKVMKAKKLNSGRGAKVNTLVSTSRGGRLRVVRGDTKVRVFLDKHPDASVAALTLRNNPRRRSRFARRNSITSGGSGYRPNRSRRNPMIQSWSGYPPIRANRKKARRNGKARRNTLRRNVGLGGGFESLRKGATDFFKGKNLGAFTVNALVAGTGFGLANFTTNWLLTTVPREGGELRKLVIDQSPWIRFGTFLFKGLVAFSIAAAAKSVKSVGVANQMTNLATGAAVSAGRDALFTISSFFPDEGRLRFQQMLLAGPLSLGEGDNQYINAPGLRSSAFAVAPNANRYASASGWNQYAQAPALGMGGYGQVSGYGQVGAYGEVGDYGTNALEAYGEALPDYSAVGGFGNSNSLKM